MEEIWKDCKYYEDLYEISNLGRVRSKRTNTIIAQHSNGSGYMAVSLYLEPDGRHGKCKREYVHRLVALTFIPNPDNKPQVDHIDTVRSNNEVSNLRWVTPSENNNNCITKAKMIANSPSAKKVLCIETGKIYNSTQEIARQFKKAGIRDHLTGHTKTYCGYHWKYLLQK